MGIRGRLVLAFATLCCLMAAASAAAQGRDVTVEGYALMSTHGLAMRIQTVGPLVVDSLKVQDQEVLDPKAGIVSGIEVGGKWYTSRSSPQPTVRDEKDGITISGIRFGGGGIQVEEIWRFVTKPAGIEWAIDRRYLTGGQIEDTACPGWNFASMSTWTGAILGTGGVAWCKLFDAVNASYGVHAGSATFWNQTSDACLDIHSNQPEMAMRFSRDPGETFALTCEPASQTLIPRQGQFRFFRDRQGIWKPFQVSAGEHVKVSYLLNGLSYDKAFSRGDFKGIDGKAVREIMNTIGRIGVVDDKIVGSNGWYSGYAVLHEPWFALMAGAVDDPAYTRNLGRSLDYQRDYAIAPDGMVKSRWAYFSGDSTPGTYDLRGFYECQWGRLMDTQPSYAINVAELFDLNGDLNWIRGQKKACERALDYLLKRDTNGNGLVEMAADYRTAGRASDWLDTIHASYENAFVNAQMYRALMLWSRIEGLLADRTKEIAYLIDASKLKASFNKSIDQGGFWDPKNQWYVYWREKDGSVHGNNLVLPVNFMAIGYGVCDQPGRRKAILAKVEEKMAEQKLFCWPVNIYPFTPDETGNQPFPNYENGDIFLAWAEMGIRAYALENPEIALKYVRNILDRYNKDGLAFQRYLRSNQSGAGDDILANNCSAVVGLYRDLYGIQPQHDRLYLAPHVPRSLDGTVLRYWLRDRWYDIAPGSDRSWVASEGWKVTAAGDFGVRLSPTRLDYFDHSAGLPSLSLGGVTPVELGVQSWGDRKRWTLTSDRICLVAQTISGLSDGSRYRLRIDAEASDLPAVKLGRTEFVTLLRPGVPQVLEIEALPR